jgi:hypothetical protein
MMKKAAIYVLVVSIGLLFLAAPALAAPQYLGETTWTLTIDHDKNGPVDPPQNYTMQGCITHQGGAYYTVQTYLPGPDGSPIGCGGGILVNGTLYLTLSHSQKHTGTVMETGVTHVELDQATLSGTFYQVARSFDTSTAGADPVFTDDFWSGTITCNGPVINLTPWASVSSTSLLLLKK